MEFPLQTKELATLLGVKPQQIVEWAEAKLLSSLKENVGSGSSRLYSSEHAERARLLCRLKSAKISVRDMRKLVPIIEKALINELVLQVPYPIKVGKHLFTLCQLPLQGPVLIEGVPPGQTVVPLMVLEELSTNERVDIGRNK